MPTSDEAGLLAAIRENHDDDTPRLVYADWLQEHGDEPRAEFIRCQCAVKRLPAGSYERRWTAYRERVLLGKYRKKWFGNLEKHFEDNCHIERGFIWRLRGDSDKFKRHSRAIKQYAPVLQEAALWHVEGKAADVLKLPFARSVRTLRLCNVTPPSLKALARASLPPNIADIALDTDDLRVVDVALRFLDSPFVRRPARLGIAFDFFVMGSGQDEVEYAEPHSLKLVERLAELDLPNLRGFGTFGVNDTVAGAIAAWPGLKRVEVLDFSTTFMDDTALPIILKSPHLGPIKKAYLDENYLAARSARAIADCPKFATATDLYLAENSISDAGARLLAKSPSLSNLTYLSLFGNRLSARGHAALAKRFGEVYQNT